MLSQTLYTNKGCRYWGNCKYGSLEHTDDNKSKNLAWILYRFTQMVLKDENQYTVKPLYSDDCVIRFIVLSDINFRALWTIFSDFLHCIIQHPVYSDTKFLSLCMAY